VGEETPKVVVRTATAVRAVEVEEDVPTSISMQSFRQLSVIEHYFLCLPSSIVLNELNGSAGDLSSVLVIESRRQKANWE